jgi:hypothetical protein
VVILPGAKIGPASGGGVAAMRERRMKNSNSAEVGNGEKNSGLI